MVTLIVEESKVPGLTSVLVEMGVPTPPCRGIRQKNVAQNAAQNAAKNAPKNASKNAAQSASKKLSLIHI